MDGLVAPGCGTGGGPIAPGVWATETVLCGLVRVPRAWRYLMSVYLNCASSVSVEGRPWAMPEPPCDIPLSLGWGFGAVDCEVDLTRTSRVWWRVVEGELTVDWTTLPWTSVSLS